MRLSAASEYGCLALLTMAENDGKWCKRAEVETRFDVPLPFLEQVLRKLNTAGLIVSRRGSQGGFKLARAARLISIAEVVRTMDGPLAPLRSASEYFYQPTPLEASVAFSALFREVRDAIADILENTTLEDIVAREHRSRSSARASGRNRTKTRPASSRARAGTGRPRHIRG